MIGILCVAGFYYSVSVFISTILEILVYKFTWNGINWQNKISVYYKYSLYLLDYLAMKKVKMWLSIFFQIEKFINRVLMNSQDRKTSDSVKILISDVEKWYLIESCVVNASGQNQAS